MPIDTAAEIELDDCGDRITAGCARTAISAEFVSSFIRWFSIHKGKSRIDLQRTCFSKQSMQFEQDMV
jgi:hypothetical protein